MYWPAKPSIGLPPSQWPTAADEAAVIAENPTDHQVGGNHYQQTALQPITVIQTWRLRFEIANVLKYLYRLGRKGDLQCWLEDIDKAIHYLQLLRKDVEKTGKV